MTKLQNLLLAHVRRYPLSTATDIFKLIYQNEFGCGHMISDENASLAMLNTELEAVDVANDVDYVDIGNGLCRLNLSAVRNHGLSATTLNKLFLLSTSEPRGTVDSFVKKIYSIIEFVRDKHYAFSSRDIAYELAVWQSSGMPIFRHSSVYRNTYKPAYRVVDAMYCKYITLFSEIDRMAMQNGSVTVAIDGNCSAGKSTLGALLQQVYDCELISMDHFFLQPEQRTEQRLAEVGGNIDYERFTQEVIQPLKENKPFEYQKFDCSIGALSDKVQVGNASITVVEGSYSMHPKFRDSYDIRVFLSVDYSEQLERILIRNGEKMLQNFKDKWIPMENEYFEKLEVESHCDIVINTSNR